MFFLLGKIASELRQLSAAPVIEARHDVDDFSRRRIENVTWIPAAVQKPFGIRLKRGCQLAQVLGPGLSLFPDRMACRKCVFSPAFNEAARGDRPSASRRC